MAWQASEWVRSDFRVRYAETDQMGIAYHSNYLIWFEVARVEFFRRFGFTYDRLEKETGTFLPVVEVQCRYLLPLRYDDEFSVKARLEEFGRRLLGFAYELVDKEGESVYARAHTKHIATEKSGRPKILPVEFLDFLRQEDPSILSI